MMPDKLDCLKSGMPEKSLSQVSRVLREQHEKGLLAFQRQNLDYAISILNQVLQQEPALYESRETLRAAQFKKAGSGSSFFKKIMGSANPMLARGHIQDVGSIWNTVQGVLFASANVDHHQCSTVTNQHKCAVFQQVGLDRKHIAAEQLVAASDQSCQRSKGDVRQTV